MGLVTLIRATHLQSLCCLMELTLFLHHSSAVLKMDMHVELLTKYSLILFMESNACVNIHMTNQKENAPGQVLHLMSITSHLSKTPSKVRLTAISKLTTSSFDTIPSTQTFNGSIQIHLPRSQVGTGALTKQLF